MKFGLYVHFPYCLQQCSYCDFATDLYKNEEKNQEYLNLLIKEVSLASTAMENKKFSTIYFGGGTPSLLQSQDFARFFEKLQQNGFSWDTDCEISLEINPATVDRKKLLELCDIGFNRFSLGVQTFDDHLLQSVGRQHTKKDSLKNLSDLSDLNLNFSCDLLFSLPNQSFDQVKRDLQSLMQFEPKHISPYILTLPERHFLQKNRPSEQRQADMMTYIHRFLSEEAYEHYEISNYAKHDFKSQHNWNTWLGESYWGIGMSAHSYFNTPDWGVRFHNPPSVKSYAANLEKRGRGLPYRFLPSNRKEFLKLHEAISDFCHTSLRLRQGLCLKSAEEKFTLPIKQEIKRRLSSKKLEPYIKNTENSASLTWQGVLFSNLVFEEMVFLREDIDNLDSLEQAHHI